jgi:hypothetical protein
MGTTMAMTRRERTFGAVVLAACAAFGLDRLALTPYLDYRASLIASRQAKDATLAEGRQTLRDARHLRVKLAGMDASLSAAPSAAEGQLVRLLQEAEQQAGVSGASFQRSNTIEEHGFTRLAFQVTATGRMPAVALLMYRMETAPIPLRVDDAQFHPKQENGQELQVHLVVSTLCRANRPGGPREDAQPPSVAFSQNSSAGGGQ